MVVRRAETPWPAAKPTHARIKGSGAGGSNLARATARRAARAAWEQTGAGVVPVHQPRERTEVPAGQAISAQTGQAVQVAAIAWVIEACRQAQALAREGAVLAVARAG